MVRYYQRDNMPHTPFLTGGLINIPFSVIHPLSGNGWERNSKVIQGGENIWWEGLGDRVRNMGSRTQGLVATSTYGQLTTTRVTEPHLAVGTVPLLGPAGSSIAGFTAAEMQTTDQVEVGATILLPEEWPTTSTNNPFNRLILSGLVLCAPDPSATHLDAAFAPCFLLYFAREASGRQGIWMDAYLGPTQVEPDSRGLRVTGVRGLLSEFGALGQFPLRNERDSISIVARFFRPSYAGLGMAIFVDGQRVADSVVGGDFGFTTTYLQSLGMLSSGQSPLTLLERHFGFVAMSFGAEDNNPGRFYAPNRIAERHRVSFDFWQVKNLGLDEYDPIFPQPTAEPDPDLTTTAVSSEGPAVGSFPLDLVNSVEIPYLSPEVDHESDLFYRTVSSLGATSLRRFRAEISIFNEADLSTLRTWLATSAGGSIPFAVEFDGESIACRLLEINYTGIGPGRYTGTVSLEEILDA